MTHEEQRELLGLAAKAAGINLQWMGGAVEVRDGIITAWNPLYDDGDALRLAVTLKIRIGFRPVAYAETPSRLRLFGDAAGDDVGAQTRLAIVRAAAEIGRKTL